MSEKETIPAGRQVPKAYEPALYEDAIYKAWEESGFFNPDNLALESEAPSYSIVMPPPNVTGTLHMGHAAMLAIEDILIRFHRMKGERTLWVPGTDHAAIATQTKVEKIIKKEGTSRHELGREKFLERVRQFAQESHDIINNQCKKVGSSCDWSREAYTLDEVRTKAVRAVFKLMHDDGLIFRGDRIVNWCPRCHSTLADDEVEYKEQKAKFYTFKYNKDFPIAISTTRPETKLGDTAVAVNPRDERYKEYVGKTFEVDFVGVPLTIKVIADHNVDQEFGTGALGVTPAHSAVDWAMAELNDLQIVKVIDEDGKIHEGFGAYSGLSAKEARKLIAQKIADAGLMEQEDEIDNKLSICYRCSTPIEPLPSLQWFINVNKGIKKFDGKSLKELSQDAVRVGVFGRKKINIIPERFEKNYFHWMDNLRDWCISRQIVFGHQIPVWYRGEETYVGVEAPTGEGWIQDTDTLDTWFSSGLWTFSTLASSPDQIKIENGKVAIDSDDYRNFHPTNVMETGYDILFFWVARMIIMTTYAMEDIPFQDVYLHGLVRDENGKKMSKSLGNVIDPLDMIKKYGTDATRLSLVLGSAPGNDMSLSEDKIAGFRNLTNKLWNIARYIITSQELSSSLDGDFDKTALTIFDKWMLIKINGLINSTTVNLESYNFSGAGEDLKETTWNELAEWYLEVSKFESGQEKARVMNYALESILKLWHPFAPFVTEQIWTELGKKSPLIIASWPKEKDIFAVDEITEVNKSVNLMIEIIQAIRNARSENKVEPAKKIQAVIYAGNSTELLKAQANLLRSLRTGIDELTITESGEEVKNEISIVVQGIEIYLIGAVDIEKEAERIKKEIVEKEKFVASLINKLSNEEFVNNAPAKIVEVEKNKLAVAEAELFKLKNKLT